MAPQRCALLLQAGRLWSKLQLLLIDGLPIVRTKKGYRTLHRAWLAYSLASAESFEERSVASPVADSAVLRRAERARGGKAPSGGLT